jgi:hypothetical protein
MHRLGSAAPFIEFQAEALTVDVPSQRVSVALDGEVALTKSPLEYRVRRRALKAIVS